MINHTWRAPPRARVRRRLDYAATEVRAPHAFLPRRLRSRARAKIDAGVYRRGVDLVPADVLPLLGVRLGLPRRGRELRELLHAHLRERHTIGTDGVHVRMVGLANLIELSLVARGAADKPKIVGRSASKLAPTSASAQRLAARGFEIDGLVCQASRGEDQVDTEKLGRPDDARLPGRRPQGRRTTRSGAHGREHRARRGPRPGHHAHRRARRALQTQLTAAQAENKTEDATAATTWLTASLTKLLTAAGKSVENLPTDVAALTAAIDAETQGPHRSDPRWWRLQGGPVAKPRGAEGRKPLRLQDQPS
jgi:hypothetical protein